MRARVFTWSAGLLLGLAAAILLLATALLASPAGSRWLIEQAASFAPGTLSFERLEGSFLAGLEAQGLDYRQEGMSLHVGRVELVLNAADLLRGRLGLRRLSIEDAAYRAPAAAEEAAPFTPPERIALPFSLDIGELSIRRLMVQVGARETVIDELDLSAHAGSISGLRIERLRVAAQGFTAELIARVELRSPYAFAALLDWRGRLPDGMEAAGHATLDGDLHLLHLDHRLAAPFRGDTRGEVRFGGDAPSVSLEGEWEALRWPLAGEAQYRSTKGRYTLTGEPPGNYRFTLAGDFEGAQIPPLAVDTQGSGTASGVVFDRLAVAALDGQLSASGTLDWKAGLAIDLGIEASGVNPGQRWPDWPGNLGLKTRLLAEVREEAYRIQLQDARLEGRLRERPVSARGNATFREAGLESDRLVLRSGENSLTLSGRVARQLDVEFGVDAPKLAQLAPDLAGSFKGTGSLHGELTRPGGRLEWSGTGLRYQEHAIGALKGQAVLDGREPQRSTARIEATDLHLGGETVSRLAFEARGWIERQRVQIELAAEPGNAIASLQGGYAGGRWSGSIERADFALKAFGNWRLREPVRLAASARALEPVSACWVAAPASACLEGTWQAAGGWRAKARLDELPLAPLARLIEIPGRIEGALDAEAEAEGSKGKTQARLHARSAQGTLKIDTGEATPYTSTYRDAEVNARYADEAAGADFRVGFSEGHAQGRVEVTRRGAAVADYPLSGELDVAVPDITFVNALTTDVNATGGSAAAKLALQGSVGAPRVSGSAELVQARLRIPDLGLELTDLGLRAAGDGTERVALSGSARSDQGTVSLQGELRLDPEAHWPLSLDIEGREFGVARLPEGYVTADPALKVSGDARRIELKGSVGIPTAKIEVKELPKSAVRVSDDEVIVGEKGAAPKAERGAGKTALVIDVTVKVGDAVHFQGLGLATNLGGELRLRSLATGDIVGDGVLKLKKGTYEGYGQKLVIEQGRLLFAGPLDDPALDIRASRRSGDVVAGVNISGTLKSPLAQVYSDPVMPEAEAMSYLLTGKPLSSTSSTESQAIAAAAGLGTSNPLAKQIAETFGVEVGTESGATEEESMVSVGKQLGEKLHVDYLYGIFNQASTLKFTYELSRYFSLSGESGLNQAIDVNVHIDRE